MNAAWRARRDQTTSENLSNLSSLGALPHCPPPFCYCLALPKVEEMPCISCLSPPYPIVKVTMFLSSQECSFRRGCSLLRRCIEPQVLTPTNGSFLWWTVEREEILYIADCTGSIVPPIACQGHRGMTAVVGICVRFHFPQSDGPCHACPDADIFRVCLRCPSKS